MTLRENSGRFPTCRPPKGTTGAGRRAAVHLANMVPIDLEVDLGQLRVSGEIPAGLRGVLLSSGSHRGEAASVRETRAANAMLHAFTIEHGMACYGTHRISAASRVSEASENLLVHGGTLLGFGLSTSPICLASDGTGRAFLDEVEALPTGAHPKLDPMTGEMLLVGFPAGVETNTDLRCVAVDSHGKAIRFDPLKIPDGTQVLDFGFSQQYLVIPVLPGSRGEKAEREANSFPPSLQVVIMKRRTAMPEPRWFQVADAWVSRVMNAWEEEDRIHVDVMQFSTGSAQSALGNLLIADAHAARLCRWTMALDSDVLRIEPELLCEIPGGLPKIDDRYAGSANRHGWFIGVSQDGRPFGRFVHLDHGEGRLDTWALPPGCCASEPVFVPRAPDSMEGEGWLLSVISRADSGHSDLLVFDSLRVHDGPLAAVHVPHRIPEGVYGCWVNGMDAALD